MVVKGVAVAFVCAAAASALVGCGRGEPSDPSTRVTSALSTTFQLPIPMGLSPQDLVIGATCAAGLNDRARLRTSTGALGDMAALGQQCAGGTTTGTGFASSFGRIWSGLPLHFRQSTFTAYFSSVGRPTIDTGTTITEMAEDRDNVPIRQDMIWAVRLSGPDSGQPLTLQNCTATTPPKQLTPGNYGAVVVNSNCTLNLANAGSYGFVSLDLEPGAKVTLGSSSIKITVTQSLILRAPLGAAGLIFAYLGSAFPATEAPFTGDLFLAPNTGLSIKGTFTAHVFAKNITVFEGFTVTGPALSGQSQKLLLPTEQLTPPKQISHAGSEIASAILNPTPGGCTEPTLFLSISGDTLFHTPVSSIGSGDVSQAPVPVPAVPNNACIETPMPHCAASDPRPGPDLPKFGDPVIANADGVSWGNLWPIKPNGTRSYTAKGVFTDNGVTRVGDGTLVYLGQTLRICTDPSAGLPQGPGCPGVSPSTNDSCDPTAITAACIYGANQCICYDSGRKTCSNAATSTGVFQCGPFERVEEDLWNIGVSSQCGADTSWTSTTIDFTDLPVQLDGKLIGKPGTSLPARDWDRDEIFYDPFDKNLYLSTGLGVGPGAGYKQQAIFSSSAAGLTAATGLHFSLARLDPAAASSGVADSPPRVMTTALDEAAQGSSSSRFVHFATFRCAEGNPAKPRLDFTLPSGGVKTVDLTTDPTAFCEGVPLGVGWTPNIWYGPSIVGTASFPPRLYIAYTGRSLINSSFEVINVYAVTLRSANQYANPIITRIAQIDLTGQSKHVFFPQLIRPDNAGSSDLTLDSPIILRYASVDTVDKDTVEEWEQGIYSGMLGPPQSLGKSSIKGACPDAANTGCFPGDYRYGTFAAKSGGKLTFFTPYSGQAPLGDVGGTVPIGATTVVTPQGM